jgi:TrmH family RNA methyltransferase
MLRLTSQQNPRIKEALALRERRDRDRSGLMLVEGYDELSLALESGACPTTLFYCPELGGGSGQTSLLERASAAGAFVVEVDERLFRHMAYREGPDGWLAVIPAVTRQLDGLPLGAVPLLVVAEAVEKPGNLGAMLRTADAAGVDALIAAAPRTDWGNPNIVRASKGALFSVPVAAATTPETVAWLHERRIPVVAATLQATTVYTSADLHGPVAIVVGTEKEGLSRSWREAAQVEVRIPMVGRVNSLNVATATALLVYEAVRQRAGRDQDMHRT